MVYEYVPKEKWVKGEFQETVGVINIYLEDLNTIKYETESDDLDLYHACFIKVEDESFAYYSRPNFDKPNTAIMVNKDSQNKRKVFDIALKILKLSENDCSYIHPNIK